MYYYVKGSDFIKNNTLWDLFAKIDCRIARVLGLHDLLHL